MVVVGMGMRIVHNYYVQGGGGGGGVGDTPYWTTITYYTDTTDGTVQ